MVESFASKPGEYVTRTFIVNVRRPRIAGDGEARLKDREKASEAWAWDDKLTLELTNSHPAVSVLDIERADRLPTVYIVGGFTSTNQSLEPFDSWGQMITAFFKPDIGVGTMANPANLCGVSWAEALAN
jgi:hypothetical protein